MSAPVPASAEVASLSTPHPSRRLLRRFFTSLRAVLRRLACAAPPPAASVSPPPNIRPAAPATIVSQDLITPVVATQDVTDEKVTVEKAEVPVAATTAPVLPTPIEEPTVEPPLGTADPAPVVVDRPSMRERRPWRPATLNRLRRKCHKCESPFIFHELECQECDHVQCDECPWEKPLVQADFASSDEPHHAPPLRTYKKPRVRVRRQCHLCNVQFGSSSLACPACQHQKCADCMRFPQRRPKTPEFDPEVLRSLNVRLAAYTVVAPATVSVR